MTRMARWQLRVGLALSLSATLTGLLIQNVEALQEPPENLVIEYLEGP